MHDVGVVILLKFFVHDVGVVIKFSLHRQIWKVGLIVGVSSRVFHVRV